MSELKDPTIYSLVFEGPVDDSPTTLQKLKGVFIADLDLTIPQVQNILQNAPISIKGGDTVAELKDTLGLLRKAGAKVLLIGANGESAEAELLEEDEEVSEETDEDIESEDELEEGEPEELEFEISFEDEDEDEEEYKPKKAKKKKQTKRIHVIEEEHVSLDATLQELGISENDHVQSEETTIIPENSQPAVALELASTSDLSLDSAPLFGSPEVLNTPPASSIDQSLRGKSILDLAKEAHRNNPEVVALQEESEAEAVSLFADLQVEELDDQPLFAGLIPEPAKDSEKLKSEPALFAFADADEEVAPPKVTADPKTEQPEITSAKLEFSGLSFMDDSSDLTIGEVDATVPPPVIEVEAEEEAFDLGISFEDVDDELPQDIAAGVASVRAVSEQSTSISNNQEIETEQRESRINQAREEVLSLAAMIAKKVEHDRQRQQEQTEVGVVAEVIEVAEVIPARERLQTLLSKNKDLIFTIFAACLLLALGNALFFLRTPEEKQDPLVRAEIQRIEKSIEAEARQLKEAREHPEVNTDLGSIWTGESEQSGVKVKIQADLTNPAKIEIRQLLITTPQPPALTAQEIIDEVPPRPWLNKVYIESTFVEVNEKGQFSLEVPARVYVVDDLRSHRVVGQLKISGSLRNTNKALFLNLQGYSKGLTPEPNKAKEIRRTPNGGYEFSVIASAVARPNS